MTTCTRASFRRSRDRCTSNELAETLTSPQRPRTSSARSRIMPGASCRSEKSLNSLAVRGSEVWPSRRTSNDTGSSSKSATDLHQLLVLSESRQTLTVPRNVPSRSRSGVSRAMNLRISPPTINAKSVDWPLAMREITSGSSEQTAAKERPMSSYGARPTSWAAAALTRKSEPVESLTQMASDRLSRTASSRVFDRIFGN